MLRTLHIRDFAIIEELEVEFSSGLNILTGETGAGKSIMIGALKMILGARASSDVVRAGARKAVVEGVFEDASSPALQEALDQAGIDREAVLIVRREIVSGYSRAFINDTPATLGLVRDVAAHLIDLHGQHDHQSLLSVDTHVDLLDGFGRLEGLRAEYAAIYESVRNLTAERDDLTARRTALKADQERLAFEMAEIDAVGPAVEEEVELEAEVRRLQHAERLFESTDSLYSMLYSSHNATADQLVVARNELRDLARIDEAFAQASEELNAAHVSVAETASMLQDYNSRIEFSPERLEFIRVRLGEYDALHRRYGGTTQSVVAHRARIGAEYETSVNFDASVEQFNQELAEAQRALGTSASRLTAKRHEVAEHIERAIGRELSDLGMAAGRLRVRFRSQTDPAGWIRLQDGARYRAFRSGMDQIEFLITTNVGEEPRPLRRVASGGEISRIMLALKRILAKSDRLPILVFDEIDTGVSGAMASRVGRSMADLARYHQIIAITHLPQIAARARVHFAVEKHVSEGRTTTDIRRLNDEEHLEQVATLMSGAEVTDAMRASARELVES